MWSWSSQDTDQAGDVSDLQEDIELGGETGPLTEVVFHSKDAPLTADKVKVLCWIMTGPRTHKTKVWEDFV